MENNYKLIRKGSAKELEQEINMYLTSGYTLAGGISAVSEYGCITYIQAVVVHAN